MGHNIPKIKGQLIKISVLGKTFDSVRHEVHSEIDNGKRFYCPTCDQHAGMSKRKITPEMASQLIRLWKNMGTISSKDLQTSVNGKSRMYSLLRHWGLIESPEPELWQITRKGREFCEGNVKVAKYAFVYNDAVRFFSGEEVTLQQCAKSVFNLQEVFETEGIKDLV